MSGSLIMPVILLVIQVGQADVDVDMMMMMMVNRPKVKVVAFLSDPSPIIGYACQ